MIEKVAAETLRRRRTQGWLVGGTVRDRQLGRYSPDLDIVVDDDPRQVAADLASRLASPWFALSMRHGAFRVMTAEGHVDVAAMQGDAIEEDLARRDFTVNAMALPLASSPADGGTVAGADALVDPFAGASHLEAGLLVAVSDTIFTADPLRLLRAPRFCHVLGMRLDGPLETLLRAEAGLLTRVAGERVANEVALTLDAGRADTAARMWADLGLLPALFPGSAPKVDTAALEELDLLLADRSTLATGSTAQLLDQRLHIPVDGSFSRPAALRLALLLRLVAPTRVADAARRLKLSTTMGSLLATAAECLVEMDHGEPALVAAGRPGRALVSFLWLMAPWEPEVLLATAAGLSARRKGGAGEDAVVPAQDAVRALLEAWGQRTRDGVPSPPLDGHQVMERLGMEPGPLLGCVLREVRLAWESGEASDEADLMEVARAAIGRKGTVA